MKRFCIVLYLLASVAAAQTPPRTQALLLEQQGKNAEAEQVWRAMLATQPRNPEALAHIGLDEARLGRYKEAIPYYRKALALDPAIPGLRLNLGLAYFKASAFQDAAREFAGELRKHPGDLRVTTLLGMAHYGAGQYAEAVPYLKTAADADTTSLPLRLALAHSCMWSHQPKCVMAVYKEILVLNPNSAEADMLAGEALDEMGDNAGALAQFRAAERANPKEPDVHFGIGYMLWTQKRYTEAAKEFEAELANDPQHSECRAYLGDIYLQLNDYPKAQAELEKAVVTDPKLEMVHLDLGIIFAQNGRNQEALKEFRRAIELDPKDADPHWRLGKLYMAMGKRSEANAEFALVRTMKRKQEQDLAEKIANAHRPAAKADHP